MTQANDSNQLGGIRSGGICLVDMHRGKPCGRPIYIAPPEVDKQAVCLMHSHDPNKSGNAFLDEIERILEDAGKGIADFTRFVFPLGRGRKRKLAAKCIFQHAVFLDDALFARVVFDQMPDFNSATFKRRAIFVGTQFVQGADFSESLFEGEARFERARFDGDADLMGAIFAGRIAFRRCAFNGQALFTGAHLVKPADFTHASFRNKADFQAVEFSDRLGFANVHLAGSACFDSAKFKQGADFRETKFKRESSFVESVFETGANFSKAEFMGVAEFIYAKFRGTPLFSEASFEQTANFMWVTFTERPFFSAAKFAHKAVFAGGVFESGAYFGEAKFERRAEFYRAKFSQSGEFSSATFAREAHFGGVVFEEGAEFRETVFREDETTAPGPMFGLATFKKPEGSIFYKTYLGQALFHNCDVSKVVFSAVRWRLRPGSGKRVLFEEFVDLENAPDLKSVGDGADERNYALIAETYQQLKKNYDERRDYWTAGDFHHGEMEMKRMSSHCRASFARRLHREMGIAALYKYASDYGESYTRPLVWLASVVLIFGLIAYPCLGLRYIASTHRSAASVSTWVDRTPEVDALRWWTPCPETGSYHTCMSRWRMAGNSMLTSVEVAAFQRQLIYEPVYAWGRFLELLEMLLTSTFIALFLLALRRKFRR